MGDAIDSQGSDYATTLGRDVIPLGLSGWPPPDKMLAVKRKKTPIGSGVLRMPGRGLEPPQPCGYMALNHARLPIPPPGLRHSVNDRVAVRDYIVRYRMGLRPSSSGAGACPKSADHVKTFPLRKHPQGYFSAYRSNIAIYQTIWPPPEERRHREFDLPAGGYHALLRSLKSTGKPLFHWAVTKA